MSAWWCNNYRKVYVSLGAHISTCSGMWPANDFQYRFTASVASCDKNKHCHSWCRRWDMKLLLWCWGRISHSFLLNFQSFSSVQGADVTAVKWASPFVWLCSDKVWLWMRELSVSRHSLPLKQRNTVAAKNTTPSLLSSISYTLLSSLLHSICLSRWNLSH